MNLMIVDDNKQIREGIHFGIEWDRYGICAIETYADGVQALEAMKTFQPDIIIADIKMPNMDGLQLLEKIKNSKSHCKYILLSAYSDFAYAQKAIQLGADDYILKPVNPTKLIQVITKNTRDIRKEEKEKEIYYKTLEKSLLYALQHETEMEDSNKLKQLLEDKYDIKLSDNSIFFSILQVEHCGGEIKKDKLSQVIIQEIREHLKMQGVILTIWENCLLFLGKGNRSQLLHLNLQYEVKMRIGQLNKMLEEEGWVITSGISEAGGMKVVKMIYDHAKDALDEAYYCNPGACILYTSSKKNKVIPEQFQQEIMEGMVKSILQKETEEVHKYINMLLEKGNKERYCKEEMVNFLKRIFIYLVRNADLECDMEFEKSEIEHAMHFTTCIQSFGELIIKFIEKQKRSSTSETYSTIINSICSYAEEHCNEQISLELMSDVFNRTPNYISSKFKKEVGKSFTNYLMELRIQKAVTMLKHTNLSINEIAEQVGFSSYDYFSRTFRKYTGKSAGTLRSGKRQEKSI